MKFYFIWPSGFRRKCLKILTDRPLAAIGQLLAHPSGELKIQQDKIANRKAEV